MVFAASRVDEESLESATLKHGYFTYFLLKRLAQSKATAPLSQIYAQVAKGRLGPVSPQRVCTKTR